MKTNYRPTRNGRIRYTVTGLTNARMKKSIKHYAKKHNLELEYTDGKLTGANGDFMDVWISPVDKKVLRFIIWNE